VCGRAHMARAVVVGVQCWRKCVNVEDVTEELATMLFQSKTWRTAGPGALCCAFAIVMLAGQARAASEEQAILDADHQFSRAAAKGDKAAAAGMLDAEFTWTDANGMTVPRAEAMRSMPQPGLGDESGATVKQLTFGQVGAVMSSRGKMQVLRIWVKRKEGWRLLVYHEVRLSDEPPAARGTGVSDCENPCKKVPFTPKNESQKAIIESWQALEVGVTTHDAQAWAPHIADEFVMVSSSNDHPFTKSDRIGILNLQKQTGVASAPAPLVSAQMFDFGDTVVMTCLHQPYSGKAVRVSRVWIKRNGKWIMAISYQTTIQGTAAKTS
jgi:hypothetical protein